MIDLQGITISRLDEIQTQTALNEAQSEFKRALRAILNCEPFGSKFALSALGEVGRLFTSGKISNEQAKEACDLFASVPEISAKYSQSLLPICYHIVTGLTYNARYDLEKEYIKAVLKFFKNEDLKNICLKVAEILNAREEEKRKEAEELQAEKSRLGIEG